MKESLTSYYVSETYCQIFESQQTDRPGLGKKEQTIMIIYAGEGADYRSLPRDSMIEPPQRKITP